MGDERPLSAEGRPEASRSKNRISTPTALKAPHPGPVPPARGCLEVALAERAVSRSATRAGRTRPGGPEPRQRPLFATRRAASATGRRASDPSPSVTRSRAVAEASTRETARRAARPRPGRRTRYAPPQRTGPGGASPTPDLLGLSLRQDPDRQTVVAGDDPGELPVVAVRRETESTHLCHPPRLQPLAEPMAAGPDDAEHDTPPWHTRVPRGLLPVSPGQAWRVAHSRPLPTPSAMAASQPSGVHPDAPTLTQTP